MIVNLSNVDYRFLISYLINEQERNDNRWANIDTNSLLKSLALVNLNK